MRLTIVGCAGSFPSPESPASCYLVEYEGTSIVLDMGNGSLGPLARHVDLRGVDAVVLSHLHADHCLDLTSYYVARAYHPDGPASRLPVHAPSGAELRIAAAYRAGPTDSGRGIERAFSFLELGSAAIGIGPFQITVAPVVHPVPAYAIRVTAGGRSLVYSGDTGPAEALVDLARGADLALFEASFLSGQSNPAGLHLTARQAAEHATAAGVPRLLLTHLVAWNDPRQSLAEAEDGFEGEVRLASPGMAVDV